MNIDFFKKTNCEEWGASYPGALVSVLFCRHGNGAYTCFVTGAEGDALEFTTSDDVLIRDLLDDVLRMPLVEYKHLVDLGFVPA